MFFFTKAREIVWGKPAETKVERRLVVKLDLYIMTFVCLMYWVNYLDRMNLNNAYVSGLKEDLNMHGTELNQINSVFYVGYTLGQIPNNILLQKVTPHKYLSIAICAWGLITLGMAFVHNWHQVMALRFVAACFESATFVGTHYILGSWYTPNEIGKRTAVFAASGVAGNMFSGILQGAIHTNMDGYAGLAGWRWLFIIDFLITLPVAFLGYFIFPGHPGTTHSKLLTEEEKKLAIERLPEVELKRGVMGWSLLRRLMKSWEFWALPMLAALAGDTEMFADNAILGLYLKELGTYSIAQINYIPTAVYAIGLTSILCCACGAIILKPPTPGAKLFALFLNGVELGYRAVLFAWANDLMREDDAKRGIVIALMNAMTICFYIWWSLLFYNAAQGPDWTEGCYALIATGFAIMISLAIVVYFERRDKKRE